MTDLADEQLLERFRHWLEETRAEADQVAAGSDEGPVRDGPADGPGIYRLVEEFTALRHEVKLQTRSARGLEDETEQLLAALRQSIDALQSIEAKEAQAAWSAAKPLALALAELDEALERGRQQFEKVGLRLVEEPDVSLLAQIEETYARQSWLRRLWLRRYHKHVREVVGRAVAGERRRQLFVALRDGYTLIQQRLKQAMAAEGISRISTLGQEVDPEQMVVLEIVEASGPPGTVQEEVRPGYTWNGRLLRSAEVRATPVNWSNYG